MELHIVHDIISNEENKHYNETEAIVSVMFQRGETNHPFIEHLKPH